MPGNYAHYRFGALQAEKLPAQFRRPIQRFRRFYDVGLYGPDIFFHHSPFWPSAVTRLGSDFHKKTGREFFTAACAAWKTAPSEAASAYLYGLLGHYCLDSMLHPYVLEKAASGAVRHPELETDFDRYLLRLDGKLPPYLVGTGRKLKLTRGECVTASLFFDPVTPAQIHTCVRNTARNARLLAHKNRRLLKSVLKFASQNVQDHIMLSTPNPRCEGMQPELLALYDQAMERYSVMLGQLADHIENGTAFGELFDPTFG